MPKKSNKVSITIDNQPLQVPAGLTILEAARMHGFYIPTLCAHKALTPFGGCRMCVVEVEGMRGLPTACTTPVAEGMVIRTNTAQVQSERREILNLILSEHPASCLICDEKDECREYMTTVRKAGVTTGCRYCPNDGQCELQEVVEKLGISEIKYPVYYRHLEVEKDDPFFDRDYNLCILCGRCVRMCQEVRAANTLAFKQRGRQTVVGPAYERTHLDAGCEFCGACVSVCPTGALSEKARKWKGKPDREVTTTCAFCGIGCQIRLQVKNGEVIGSLPADDSLINNGQLCVKGRFCITELVNNHSRLKGPYRSQNGTRVEILWDDAVELASERLSACPPNRFGMIVSPNCSNEDLYVAQKFARVAMASNNIDTSARLFYGPAFNAYLDLMKRSVPLSAIREASVIFCVGLDTRFSRSVAGVELRKAVARGARVITLNSRNHNLSLLAYRWLRPAPDREVNFLRALVGKTSRGRAESKPPAPTKIRSTQDELSEVAAMLRDASAPIILVGTEFMKYDGARLIVENIARLAENVGAGILPLPAFNNLIGSLLMGAYPELLPGGFSSVDRKTVNRLKENIGMDVQNLNTRWNCQRFLISSKPDLKALYLIGARPTSQRPPADFIIYQDLYPPEVSYPVDLVLPAAAFTEANGSFINGAGRVQRVRKAVESGGAALPDWEILCRIARKMGKSGFDFTSVSEVDEEISRLVGGFGDFKGSSREPRPFECRARMKIMKAATGSEKRPDREYPFLLYTSEIEHVYRGYPLARWVEGLRKLLPVGVMEINKGDAEKLGLSQGDKARVTSASFEKIWPVEVTDEQPRGTLHVTLNSSETVCANPYPVRVKKDV